VLQKIKQNARVHTLFNTFCLLLRLIRVFNYFMNRKYERCLTELEALGIIPFCKSEVDKKSQTFKEMDEKVQKKISDILFVTMSTLYHLYTSKTAIPQDDISQKADSIMSFAGQLSNKISKDVNDNLLKFQTKMRK